METIEESETESENESDNWLIINKIEQEESNGE
jgi:hypothetical protein